MHARVLVHLGDAARTLTLAWPRFELQLITQPRRSHLMQAHTCTCVLLSTARRCAVAVVAMMTAARIVQHMALPRRRCCQLDPEPTAA